MKIWAYYRQLRVWGSIQARTRSDSADGLDGAYVAEDSPGGLRQESTPTPKRRTGPRNSSPAPVDAPSILEKSRFWISTVHSAYSQTGSRTRGYTAARLRAKRGPGATNARLSQLGRHPRQEGARLSRGYYSMVVHRSGQCACTRQFDEYPGALIDPDGLHRGSRSSR